MNSTSLAQSLDISLRVSDNVRAMLAYWDKDLLCRFANNAYIEWFGKTREEMVDKITIDQLLGPLFEKNLPYIQNVLAGEPQTFEREIILPGGEVRHSLANYYPDIIDGEVVGFFAHVADISAVKKMKIQIEESNRIIQSQNERIMNFAYTVSHNLKSLSVNLETIIKLNTKGILTTEQLVDSLAILSKDFKFTVETLNSVAEIQTQRAAEKIPLCLYDFVEESIQSLHGEITLVDAIVRNEIDPTIQINYNLAYLKSILLNLLTNAIKYRKENSIPEILISSSKKDGRYILIIKDNGIGLDLKRYGHKLFGMYKTFHGNADSRGVGLFMTKYQVEVMGGAIEVESQPGNGATFTVYFPETEKEIRK